MAHSTESTSRDDTGTVLTAVADRQRRAVLRSLHHADSGSMSVEALTKAVADRLGEDEISDEQHHQRLLIALHRNHLPKLDAAGLVVYAAEQNAVRSTSDGLGAELLDTVESYDTA